MCPGGPDFEPMKGVIPLDNGLRCLDFDVLIQYSLAFPQRKLPGGRHVTNVMESMGKLDKARRKYRGSEKGKEAQNKWKGSKKGKKSTRKFQDSPRFKLSRQKYEESQKGQEALQEQKDRKKFWRKAQKWLQKHPGKTLEDYTKEVGNDK